MQAMLACLIWVRPEVAADGRLREAPGINNHDHRVLCL
jgi:hypothetical protein